MGVSPYHKLVLLVADLPFQLNFEQDPNIDTKC